MSITLNSIVMTIFCSTILIVLLSLFRTQPRFLDICSISGIIILFLVCMARLVIPLEFSWTKVVQVRAVYNPIMLFLMSEIPLFENHTIEVSEILLVVWILGALSGVVRMLLNYRKVSSCVSDLCCIRAEKADELLYQISSGQKRKNLPYVFKSDQISAPIGYGLRKKAIIIPDREYDERDLKYIILHEYTHFRNKDIWVKLLINLLCVVYWWNPFVYLLRRKLNDCFEIRCDKRVVKEIGPDNSADYLTALLNTFRESVKCEGKNNAMLKISPQNTNKLKERFSLVASVNKKKQKIKGNLIAVVIIVGLIVLSYSFIFQAGFDVPLEEVESEPGAYSIDTGDSYFFKNTDGKYYMKTSGGTVVEIEDRYVEILKETGFSERSE